MSAIDELLRNNEAYAAGFDKGHLPSPPEKKIAIVACMDARLDLTASLGLKEGDAHVIRNAGGVVTDEELRSLAVSQHLLGTEEIMLVHHTKCGMQTITDDELAARLREETGQEPPFRAHAFDDLEQDVRDAIRRIEDSPFIPRTDNVRGFVYDVETGKLREVG